MKLTLNLLALLLLATTTAAEQGDADEQAGNYYANGNDGGYQGYYGNNGNNGNNRNGNGQNNGNNGDMENGGMNGYNYGNGYYPYNPYQDGGNGGNGYYDENEEDYNYDNYDYYGNNNGDNGYNFDRYNYGANGYNAGEVDGIEAENAYAWDEDGDGNGGAWINGKWRPFCEYDGQVWDEQENAQYNQNGQNMQYQNGQNQNGGYYRNGQYQYWNGQQDGEEDGEEYNYNNRGGQYGQYYFEQNHDDGDCIEYRKYIPHQNCQQGIITVKSVSISCNSPYQFYYGNGAHRNSQLCDYGDKAMVTVFFKNAYDLPRDKPIYLTMGVYARKNDLELVYAARNVELCETLVGHQCTAAGNYAFAFMITLDYVFGDRSAFVPVVEMGFSDKPDDGYNMGGVNINCVFDRNYRPYDPWLNKSTTWGAGTGFAANYGLLIGVLLLLVAFAMYAYKKNNNQIEWTGVEWPKGMSFPQWGQKKSLEQELVRNESEA